MPVSFNRAAFRKASFNGNKLRRIFCNGVLVWRSIPEYLYSAGNETEEVTGGWEAATCWSTAQVQKLENGIRLYGAGSGAGATGNDNVVGVGFVYTKRPVDLTDVYSLSATVSGTLNGGRAVLGVTDDPSVWARMREPQWIAMAEEIGVKQLNGTITLDVSAVSGSHYVIVAAAAQGYFEGLFADIAITRIGCS